MHYNSKLALLLILFIPFIIQAETHVGGEMEGGTWTHEGSPYIVDETVEFPDSSELIIEPGVVVRFAPHRGISGRNLTLVAEGTPDDSIYFIGDDGPWACIHFGGEHANAALDYCYFYEAYGFWNSQGALTDVYGSLTVRHSTFRGGNNGITDARSVLIEDCVFDSLVLHGIAFIYNADVRRTIISNIYVISGISALDNGSVENCVFRNIREYGFSGDSESRLSNSIFTNCRFPLGGGGVELYSE